MTNFAIFISGSGTNLQAIIDAQRAGNLDANISLVVSSRPGAYGITRAQEANIPVLVMNKEDYADPQSADTKILDALHTHNVDYVAMAGYMRKVTPVILDAFPSKVINIHPALLPSFKGAHAIEDAYKAGVKITGVTVHLANEEYDKGTILAQEAVRVEQHMTQDELEEAIHKVEHELYPRVLQSIAHGQLCVE